ncbi:MAG TPA: radical SAM/SPASM domain-containing protein [Planctomycetota bacterium]|nr:radical SAM/SPASM domain-containing protein [Planctomycetota bacterium]
MSQSMRGTPFVPRGRATEHDFTRELAPLEPQSITVLIDVSNKCNLRCCMCYFAYDSVFHRKAIYLRPEQFARIAQTLFPHAHTVYLSAGNEPLTSPWFTDLLRIAAPYRIPDLKFLTNGLLMRPEICEAILDCGVSQVHLSIDGATKASYEAIRVGGQFERFVENVRYLAQRKRERGATHPILQFNVTLMRSNLRELESFVDLASELGVERIACRHVMAYAGLGIEKETLDAIPIEANRAFRRFLERADRSQNVLVVNFPDLFSTGEESPPPARSLSAEADPSLPKVPFGAVDKPRRRHLRGSNALQFQGWALDAVEVAEVWLGREPFPGESSAELEDGLVRIGRARFHNGSRPDVAMVHRRLPLSYRSGWGFELRREALPAGDEMLVQVHVRAVSVDGRKSELGRRTLLYSADDSDEPYLYCRRPFENVYIDAEGKVYPYPDCQTVDPFGDLGEGKPFESIWYGAAFSELRQRIIARDPPAMCLTCPDFINRSVDDRNYFSARAIEQDFRKPFGFVDQPRDPCEVRGQSVMIHGWALGFDEFEGVRLEREALAEEGAGERGRIVLGEARFVAGIRPDVAAAYPHHPKREEAGWHFEVRRDALPSTEAEPVVVHAVARNRTGQETHLGSRRIRFVAAAP